MSSAKSQKLKLNLIDLYGRLKKSQSTSKKDRSYSDFKDKNARIKTQGDQNQRQGIFNYKMSESKDKLGSLYTPIKQVKKYEEYRNHFLKSQFEGKRIVKKNFDIKIRQGSRRNSKDNNISRFAIDEISKQKSSKYDLINNQHLKLINFKDLEINLLNLMKVLDVLFVKGEYQQMLKQIKNYILQQNSDLNEIERVFAQQAIQLEVKRLIYYERVLLIFLVEAIVNGKYKFYQTLLRSIFRELAKFYSILLFFLTQKTLLNLIENIQFQSNMAKHLDISQAHTKQSLNQISQIKNSMISKFKILFKSFPYFHVFIASQTSKIKDYSINLLYYNLLQFFAYRLAGGDWSTWGIQFLETCPSPYVHYVTQKKYTLLLDLDETLVHYKIKNQTTGQFLLRPYLFQFLSQLTPHFQLGIFTCSLKEYADIIVNHMKSISIRLYRQHAIKVGNELIKDLSRVGRQLTRVILVDNLQKNFRLQKDNGIHVRSWYGDSKDLILKDLAQQLIKLSLSNPEDIRKSNHRRSFL